MEKPDIRDLFAGIVVFAGLYAIMLVVTAAWW